MEYLIFDTENFNKYNNDEYKKIFRYCVDFKKNKYFGGESNKRRNWIGKMIYDSGDIYEGYWKNHKKHGFGIMRYVNGNIYRGSWEYDKKIGFGKMQFKEHPDFISFEGEWDNDKFIKGKVVYKNGEIYDGDFINEVKDGFGKLLYKKGQSYEGQWKNNKRDGEGTYIFESGSVYIGQWVGGERHGHGILNYNGGNIYQGNWANSEKHGYGEMEYENGNIYKGNWNDERYGQGKMIYANGDVYEGEWNEERFGQGKMIYANGDVYEGEWNIMRHGHGKIICANGDVFQGEWNRDFKNGKGILTFANSDTIEGEWKKNQKNGIMLFHSNNKKYIQSWDCDDKLDEIELDTIFCSEITIRNIYDIDKIEIKIMNERELPDDDLIEIRCPISFEYLFNPVVTSCNHIFSKKSLDQYMAYKNECPICRSKVTSYNKLKSISGYQNIESIVKKCLFTVNNQEIEFEKIIRLKNFL
jgi:hypothetical protein